MYFKIGLANNLNRKTMGNKKAVTVLNVHTDQSGIVGLVRRLHGLGMTVLQLQIVSRKGKTAETD